MRAHASRLGFVALCATIGLACGGCGGIVDEQAEQKFRRDLGNTSITVFPAFVRDGEQHRYDASAAGAMGESLTQAGLATVTVSAAQVPITSQWGMNQAKMFRDSAADFSTYVRANPIETDYALLAEYLIGGGGVPVGVHLYLVDAQGTVAYAILFNSHHSEFTDVNPQRVEDCTIIAANKLRHDFAEQIAAKSSAPPARAKKMGPASSLTIVPVMLAGNPSKDVADVVGLLLEKEGMPNIVTVDTTFQPPPEAALQQVASSFAQFVRNHPFETDYTLFGEFIGSPAIGVAEVRAVLVDKAGTVVWSDRQTPEDADFKRIGPRNPMTCCVLLSERLKPEFGLSPATRGSAGEGRMAKLWAEKSGTPSKEQWAAMARRQQQMKEAIADSRVLVYPVRLASEVSSEDAGQLVDVLGRDFKCDAVVSETPLRINVAPSSNEQRRLWDLARAFREQVRKAKPDADYALFAEYTIRPRDQKVWSVHFVVCDRAGEWVIVDFQNEHQPDFKSLDPQTRADCGRLVARRLAGYLR